MNPRMFIGAIGGILLAVPVIAEAQQTMSVPRIGLLVTALTCAHSNPLLNAFREGLRQLGYVEGRNIEIECRSAEGNPERIPELAAELSKLKVAVIVAAGGESVARAVGQASRTIPIVMTNASDPVETGLVASLARPGGNVTGLVTISPGLGGKRLELLKQAFPKIARVAILTNPSNPEQGSRMRELQVAADALDVQLQLVEVRKSADLESALSTITRLRADALLPLGDPLIVFHRNRIVEFAAKNRMPAMYHRREFVEAGGLMVYGPSYKDLFRRAAGYVDKILKGAAPGTLPIEQPTQFEFVINLKTAGAQGLTMPQSLLVRADEVIR